MTAPRMRRRYRTSSPKRGLLYLFLFLVLSASYVGQRVYTQRLRVELGLREKSIKTMQDKLQSLQAERDRLTSLAVLGPRAQLLGLRAAEIKQLARVPLTLPPPVPEMPESEPGLLATLERVWRWLDGAVVQEQGAIAKQ